MIKIRSSFIGTCVLLSSCVNTNEFEPAESSCTSDIEANVTFSEVKSLYQGDILQIQEDWVIEGYVVSSDRAKNFFSVLHFQDSPIDPSEGFQIEIDVRDNCLLFPEGSRILIKLKGLYLGQSKDVFKLGGTFAAFGTTSVGRLPSLMVPEHIFVSCDAFVDIVPRDIAISELNATMTNTLVRFRDMEVVEEELDSTFALKGEGTKRHLIDCSDDGLTFLNSGFSDFQAEPLPQGKGSITGVLLRENDDYFLAIRDRADIDFGNERCAALITEFTSNALFFSELADPNNNADARFLELYNSANTPLDLNGWSIRRYTNANTDISSTIDLTGLVIDAESTLVISPNATAFETVYGFPPDLGVGTNSPADSNGDDNLELVDPFGTVIDVFGVIGEDGSGTNHEFEDGRAVRNPEISTGNPTYTFLEWTIFNDSGRSGTLNQPQNAPEDFSPGSRN